MKKKNKKLQIDNQLPQMFWGGKLAPQLFDLAANTLINGTTYAVTDMIKAIREPEQEIRPTKMNTGFTMANGGVIKRADGSYSQRGLWDNIRANKGSGKKPTKQMLEQERKIKAKSKKANGGIIEPDPTLPTAPVNMFSNYDLSNPDYDTAMTGMMKARMALDAELGRNSSAKRMTSVSPKEYTFTGNEMFYDEKQDIPAGATGTHYMTGEGNVAFPIIQEGQDGNLFFNRYASPYDKEAMKFETPNEAEYFGMNYKNIAPMMYNTQEYGTGGTIHIKPSKRGTFTAAAKKHGKSVQAFASQVLANKDNYSPAMVKKANFARNASKWKHAFGGMITPDMYMQQMMYGSYANGGQVPQNIPVEVEGQEMYEMPNGQVGEFEGPSHEQGGIPIALPEGTEVFSKRLKVDGKSMADRKKIRENNVAKLEKLLNKNPSDKFIREALKRQKETAELEEQSDMAIQQQANQKQQMQEQAQQGMMQEQAMAGLMQDPAMMQQMGMMMYGGKLNKLANGGEPVPPGYGKLYSGFGSYPDYFYKQQIVNHHTTGKPVSSWSYFNPKGKGTDWVEIPEGHAAIGQLDRGVVNNPKYYVGESTKVGELDSGVSKYITNTPDATYTGGYKFPQADLSIKTPEVTPINMSKLQPISLNSVISLNPNEKYLGNQDGFSVIGGKDDEMLIKNTNSSTPGVNPYDVMSNILGQTFGNIALSKDPYINTKGGMIPNPLYNEVIGNKMLQEEESKKPNKFMNFLNKAADETGDFFTGLFDKKGKPKKEGGKKGETKSTGELPFTAGDYMGMAGTLFGGLAPMTTTMLNRMMTPKNQNFFREYGAEGLRAMQEAQALSAINRDKQLADIKLGEEASRQRGRNSARGVNTLRAMDIASDMTANQAQNQAYNAYAQQMMQMLGQKAQMENQQDQMVMQGEYQRDLADRQDVDQFYTNLAQNFASQSELMQKQGRDMNQAQYNKMILEMSPMFSKYGIGVEMRNGKVVFVKDGETIDETTARLEVKKGLEKEKTTGTTSTTSTSPTNPLGLGHTPYFNPIFTDINIPTVTDKSLTKAATKRRK